MVIVGAIKDMKKYAKLPNQLDEYLVHNISLKKLLQTGVSNQRLKDLADITLMEYLIGYGNGRPAKNKNWVSSETRLIMFNGDKRFETFKQRELERNLKCLVLVFERANKTACYNCVFHAETVYALSHMIPKNQNGLSDGLRQKLRSILDIKSSNMFSTYSYLIDGNGPSGLKTNLNTLGERLQYTLAQEGVPESHDTYLRQSNFFALLDARVECILQHVELCYRFYYDKIFI